MLVAAVSLFTTNAVNYAIIKYLMPLSARHNKQTQLTKATRFLSAAAEATTPCQNEALLSCFRAIAPFEFSEKVTTHPHAPEAAHRLHYQRQMEACVRQVGKQPYHLGAGKRESHLNGSRGMLMPLDFASPNFTDPIKDDHVLCLIDCDYYIDMNLLLKFGKPILIYTFSPKLPAGKQDNTSWKLDDGCLVYTTRGAETYKHPLWEYDGVGELVVHDDCHTITHRVDSLDIGNHRRLILISPVARIAPVAIRTNFCSRYLSPTVDEIVSTGMDVMLWTLLGIFCLSPFTSPSALHLLKRRPLTNPAAWIDGNLVHVVAPGDVSSFTTTVDALNAIRLRSQGSQLRISEVQALLPVLESSTEYVTDRTLVAPRIHKLLGGLCDDIVLTPVAKQVGPLPDAPTKPLTRCLPILPVAHGAVHLSKGYNEERASVLGRVTNMANDAEPPTEYMEWAAEFAVLCVPEKGKIRPLDQDEVEALQNRPTQRAKLDLVRNVYGFLQMIVKSFGKAEAAAKATAMRNVSTVPADFRVEYSRFTLAASKFLAATTTWYAFSKTPQEFSKVLHAKVSAWNDATENDFTKFDATNGICQAVIPRMVLARLFPDYSTSEINKMTLEEVDPPAFTTSGIPYSPGYGTLSGSPSTSFRNSLNNAFVAYATYRRIGMSMDDAYGSLGIYGGDDGLDNGAIADELPKTSAALGLRSKTKLIKNGEAVTFLGRVYPNPWATECSFSDLARHLPKLHITSEMNPSVHSNDILRRKATGFMATDPKTPILSDWAKYVLDHYPSRSTVSRECNWWARSVEEDGPFPQLSYDDNLPFVAISLGLTRSELLLELQSIRNTGHFTRPLNLRVPHSVTGDMFVGDLVIEGTKADNEALTTPPPVSSELRKLRKRKVTFATKKALRHSKFIEISRAVKNAPAPPPQDKPEVLKPPSKSVAHSPSVNSTQAKKPAAEPKVAKSALKKEDVRARARANNKTTTPPASNQSNAPTKAKTRSTAWRAKEAPSAKL
jgi:hypothetical protein